MSELKETKKDSIVDEKIQSAPSNIVSEKRKPMIPLLTWNGKKF